MAARFRGVEGQPPPEEYYSKSNDEAAVAGMDEDDGVEPEAVFYWLNRRNPKEARLRLAKIYWRGWHRLILSFFLLAFGVTFLFIGVGCMRVCTEADRGIAFFVIGLIMFMPGMYSAVILFYYLRGHKGYSYKMLPDPNA